LGKIGKGKEEIGNPKEGDTMEEKAISNNKKEGERRGSEERKGLQEKADS